MLKKPQFLSQLLEQISPLTRQAQCLPARPPPPAFPGSLLAASCPPLSLRLSPHTSLRSPNYSHGSVTTSDLTARSVPMTAPLDCPTNSVAKPAAASVLASLSASLTSTSFPAPIQPDFRVPPTVSLPPHPHSQHPLDLSSGQSPGLQVCPR